MLLASRPARRSPWVGSFARRLAGRLLRSLGVVGAVGALAALLGASAEGCSPNIVCKLAGPINDPSNHKLRRDIMQLGLGKFCEEMTRRSAPLAIAPDPSIVGRFFPQHCTQEVLDNGDLWARFDGFGYAWTPLSRKVTFTSAATLEYNQDFRCADDSAIFAYFDTKNVSPPEFRLAQIEQPGANLVQDWIAPYANGFGQQMLAGELRQGFTVIQEPNGSADFSLGHLPLGQRPFHPYDVHGSGRLTYENLRVAVHAGERDFIGPIDVQSSGRAIFLRMHLEGATAVNVYLVPRSEGDASLQLYFQYGPVGPLAYPPRFSDVVRYGAEYERAVPVPAGMYYVVLDNTPPAGSAGQLTAAVPLLGAIADPPAMINYAIQIGDAP